MMVLSYDDLRSHEEIGFSLSRQIIYGYDVQLPPNGRRCSFQIINLMELYDLLK